MYSRGTNTQPRLTEIEKVICKQFSYIDIDRLIALCLHWVGEVLEVSFVITLFFIKSIHLLMFNVFAAELSYFSFPLQEISCIRFFSDVLLRFVS